MKVTIKNLFALALVVSFSGNALSKAEDLQASLTGPYLGQKAPGLTPEVFAPDIVSTKGWEYGVVFSPRLDEMYFVREVMKDNKPHQEFIVFEQNDDKWRERVISKRVGTPTLSPDNKTMFFGRSFKTRTDSDWSEMQRLGPDFEEFRIMRVTASLNGTIAFDVAEKEGVLRYSTLENGKRLAPKPFPKHINTGLWNAHPFIAPDESYVIWDGQRGGDDRNSDLFISFKRA